MIRTYFLSFVLVATFLLSGCETVYVAPTAGPMSQLTTVYKPSGLHAVVQVRRYPDKNVSGFGFSYMKNLGGEAVRGHVPTYTETYQIPAEKDFYFGFNLIKPSSLISLTTCMINMRLLPEDGQHYEAVFTSYPSHCTSEVFRIVRSVDGSVQRVLATSVVKIE